VILEQGLEATFDATSSLRRHELVGDDGPPGSGVVAFGALPFDRSAPSQSTARYCITQTSNGDAWITSPEARIRGAEYSRDDGTGARDPEPALALTPAHPDEYAHNVALAVEILRSKEIDKVVLARSVRGTVPEAIDAAAVAQRLQHREPLCTIFSIPPAISDASWERRRSDRASHGRHAAVSPVGWNIALPPNVEPETT